MLGRKTSLFPLAGKRVLAVLLGSGVCIDAFLLWSERQELVHGYADFTIFYSAANIIRSGQAKELYNEQVQYLAQLAAAPDVVIRNVALPYNHPPFEALLFVPLSHLPYFAAYLVWAACNLAMLLTAVWLLRRQSCALKEIPLVKFFLLTLIFFPVFVTLFQGQDLLLLLLIVCSSYALLQSNADFCAGCSLGLAVFRPELAFPIALMIFAIRRKRFAAGFLTSAFTIGAVSAYIIGWQSFLFYPKYVYRMERISGYGSIVPADMPNLRGVISLFIHNQYIVLMLTVIASFIIAAYALRFVRFAANDLQQVFSVAIVFSLLVSYHALVHDLALLIISIIFTYVQWVGTPDKFLDIREHWASVGAIAFFLCTPLLVWLWLGIGLFSLSAPVLALWLWDLSRVTQIESVHAHALRQA